MNARLPMLAAMCLLLLCIGMQISAQQQIADPDFVVSVEGLLDRGVAEGRFEVVLTPESVSESGDGASIGRMSLRKVFHGVLEGTGSGEMLMVRTGVDGSAGYVAIERFTGRLGDRRGSFLLQHYGIMDRNEPSLRIEIIPDSGTGDLNGITGTMSIEIDDGHFYRLDYSFH